MINKKVFRILLMFVSLVAFLLAVHLGGFLTGEYFYILAAALAVFAALSAIRIWRA